MKLLRQERSERRLWGPWLANIRARLCVALTKIVRQLAPISGFPWSRPMATTADKVRVRGRDVDEARLSAVPDVWFLRT